MKSLYKTFVLFIGISFVLFMLDSLGLTIWPGLVFSYENFIVLFVFALSVVLAATY
jgi:hypothetical protein